MSNSTGGDARVPEDLKNVSTEHFWDKYPLLLLQNLLTASKHPRNSLSSSCYSLLVSISVLKHSDSSFSQPKPLSQLQTITVFSLRSGSDSSSRAVCFWISTRWSNVNFWSWKLSNANKLPTPFVRICALYLIYCVWRQITLSGNIVIRGIAV